MQNSSKMGPNLQQPPRDSGSPLAPSRPSSLDMSRACAHVKCTLAKGVEHLRELGRLAQQDGPEHAQVLAKMAQIKETMCVVTQSPVRGGR